MKFSRITLPALTLALTVGITDSASALTININAGANLASNAAALAAFERAADSWEAIFSDPVTIEIDADLSVLASGVIGSAASVLEDRTYNSLRSAMINDALSDEAATNAIVGFLPTSATLTTQLPTGIFPSSSMTATRANLKALGYSLSPGSDATITFNSNFAFDYDNSNGVSAGTKDFETVAAHEIGHALGFISSVDVVDFALNNDPNAAGSLKITPLDLFRFGDAANPTDNTSFTLNPRNLTPDTVAYFDDLDNEYAFSTGDFTGDGHQASHWKADEITGNLLGIFDPTLQNGFVSPITTADIRALDLIGWDLAIESIPAPAGLGIFLIGLGALGLTAARRRKLAS